MELMAVSGQAHVVFVWVVVDMYHDRLYLL